MNLPTSGSSTTFRGPVATQLYAWTSTKYQLWLEAKGLRSSGGAIRPRIAASLGLKPRAGYAAFEAAIERKLDELAQQLKQGDIQHG